jgi:ATP-dependent protease HslVU (ClpYQ) peptidase subunit
MKKTILLLIFMGNLSVMAFAQGFSLAIGAGGLFHTAPLSALIINYM